MTKITFETKLYKIGTWTILRIPPEESAKLPSRGMVMLQGTINGVLIKNVFESDGWGSHWMRVENKLSKEANIKAGDTVKVEVETTKEWINPEVPKDLKKALTADQKNHRFWVYEITPAARWEWIRWIRATNNPETREKRIRVAISKMESGERRPCCFNRNACSEPYVSHGWQLIEANQT